MEQEKAKIIFRALLDGLEHFWHLANLDHHAHPEGLPTQTYRQYMIEQVLSPVWLDALGWSENISNEALYPPGLTATKEGFAVSPEGIGFLPSIFDRVELRFRVRDEAGDFTPDWYYCPSPLLLAQPESAKEIFPTRFNVGQTPDLTDSMVSARYRNLWDNFIVTLKGLVQRNLHAHFPQLFNEFFYLLQKFTWCLPGGLPGAPEVSLFDHLKAAAAVAACRWEADRESPSPVSEFLLFGADLSGIQSFIFRIVSGQGVGNIAKRLRGRSFALMMLGEILSRYLIHELKLTLFNLNFCGGGNLELLLSNTEATKKIIKDFEQKVNDWLLKEFSGQLGVVMAWVPLSSEHLESRFNEKKTELQDLLATRKKRKYFPETPPGHSTVPSRATGPLRICRACNHLPAEKIYGPEICDGCEKHRKIGYQLPKTQALLFAPGTYASHPVDCLESLEFGFLGKIFLLKDRQLEQFGIDSHFELVLTQSSLEPFQGFTYLGNVLPVALKDMKLDTEKDPEGDQEEQEGKVSAGKTLSFNTIAAMAQGDSKIGILKMDVDQLGSIFSLGLGAAGAKHSLESQSALSRLLSYFLGRVVAAACQEITDEWRLQSPWGETVGCSNDNVSSIFYLVFSGGDDLIIIGPWDRIIDLADLIRNKFKDYTCHNPNLTISAGVCICKPKYPISLAADQAEEALARSKAQGRNRITLFGDTTVWDREDRIKSHIFKPHLAGRYTMFEDVEICRGEFFCRDTQKKQPVCLAPFSDLYQFHKTLLKLYKDKDGTMPRRFAYRLLEGREKYFPVTFNLQADRQEEQHNYMIFPYLTYLMQRNLEASDANQLKAHLITSGRAPAMLRQIKIPTIMFLMKTRRK